MQLGRLLALAGLALAAGLFANENVGGIVDLVIAAGPGLVAASVFHVAPMILNARAWQRLLPAQSRSNVLVMTWATWIRESVNALLPVGRIGGELVAYRILRRSVVRRTEAAASLVADMALSVLSQACFALLGLCLLVVLGHSPIVTTPLLAGVAIMMILGAAFVLVPRVGALSAVTSVFDRIIAGRLRGAVTQSLRLERAIRAIYERRRDVVACFAWQLAGWIFGAGEIWLALHFLGHPRSLLDAIVIEALIQAISSAAFVVPGALGVQEGGFMLIGAALGIDGTTSLALATARRLRDLIVFLPGVIAWQRAEAHARTVTPGTVSESP